MGVLSSAPECAACLSSCYLFWPSLAEEKSPAPSAS